MENVPSVVVISDTENPKKKEKRKKSRNNLN